MKRSQLEGLFDLGLSMADSFASSTETQVDDTLIRFTKFARKDASWDAVMERLFPSVETAPLRDDAGVEIPIETTALALAEPTVAEFAKTQNITVDEATALAGVLISIFAAIRKARQAKKAGG